MSRPRKRTQAAPVLTLDALEGRWRMRRAIEDRRAGLDGLLDGVSEWRRDGPGLRQQETGLLRYGDAAPMQASRVYLWRAAGAELAVFFEDGRPFHRVGGAGTDRHHCPPDIYDVTYDLGAWPDWSTTWIVTGPRKDLRLVTRYSRAD